MVFWLWSLFIESLCFLNELIFIVNLSRFPLCLKKIFEKLFDSFNLIIFPFEVAVYQNKYKDVPTIYHNDDSAHDVG